MVTTFLKINGYKCKNQFKILEFLKLSNLKIYENRLKSLKVVVLKLNQQSN